MCLLMCTTTVSIYYAAQSAAAANHNNEKKLEEFLISFKCLTVTVQYKNLQSLGEELINNFPRYKIMLSGFGIRDTGCRPRYLLAHSQ